MDFVNIYVLNDSNERCILWEQLILSLTTTCRWIIAEDFNMVEQRCDKTNPCRRLIPFREHHLFNSLKEHLQLSELARSTGILAFSWDNQRWDGACLLARLDRVYIFRQTLPSGAFPVSQYVIRGDGTLFDHCPLYLSILLEDRHDRCSRWKMNSAYLKESKKDLQQVWKSRPPQAPFFSKIRAVIRYYKILCRDKAKGFREQEEKLRQQLHSATQELQTDPTDLVLQEQHGLLLHQVKDVEERAARGKRIRSRVRWMLNGDVVNCKFFQAVQEKLEQLPSHLYATLRVRKLGIVVEYRNSAANIMPAYTQRTQHGRRTLGSTGDTSTYPRIFYHTNGCGTLSPILATELHSTLKKMARERSPGPDGLSIDFYLTLWEVLGEEYTSMINHAIQVGHLLLGMTKRMLVLLHKGGERESLDN
jgi:hypothetical protein